jgi:NAD-dependent SIR2 family protein deacetylase
VSIVRCEHCEQTVDLDFVDQYIDGHSLCASCQEEHGDTYIKLDIDKKIDKILREVRDEDR